MTLLSIPVRIVLSSLLAAAACVHGGSGVARFPLTTPAGLHANDVVLSQASFGERSVLQVTMANDLEGGGKNTVAVVEGTDFQDGTIEFDVASGINPESPQFVHKFARGFAGIAFRIDPQLARFESIYLRPTNGRADDAARRAHAVQYFSYPDYDFKRLRQESPGKYEAAADIGPDEWIQVKIEVRESTAKLFLNGREEPTLIVNDLKHGPDARGSVGLFVDSGTRAYFSNLQITPFAD